MSDLFYALRYYQLPYMKNKDGESFRDYLLQAEISMFTFNNQFSFDASEPGHPLKKAFHFKAPKRIADKIVKFFVQKCDENLPQRSKAEQRRHD